MLRESRARWLAFATVGLLVGLAALFAWLRNPPGEVPRGQASVVASSASGPPAAPAAALQEPSPGQRAAAADPVRIAAGRAAFQRLNCGRCHAIDGQGNPATPLDGVGARLDPAALRDWTLGTGAAAEQLPSRIVRAKSSAAQDSDVDALIEYLAQSR